MKINLKLLVIILGLEILYFYVMFFILLFSFFMYFGSGASSENQLAITLGKIANFAIILPPILFNFHKAHKLKVEGKTEDKNSYLIASILYFLFIIHQIYSEFLNF